MASIYKRPNAKTYNVIYDVYEEVLENGEVKKHRKPVWITGLTFQEAKKKKLEIETQQQGGLLINPMNITVAEFMQQWLAYYKKRGNAVSTCQLVANCINLYISPDLGDRKLQTLSPKDIEDFFLSLKQKHHSQNKYNYADWDADKIPLISTTTARHIYVYFKMALDKAVEWKVLSQNPIKIPPPPKADNPAEAWDEETLYTALSEIKDPLLHLCLHLAFVCSLRAGEIGGVTWDCINWKDGSILFNKIIQRLSKDGLRESVANPPILIFPNKIETRDDIKSCLVMKQPKTPKSKRTIYVTTQLLEELLKWKQCVDRRKLVLGDMYHDYNLVICLEDGTPVEPKLIAKWFSGFIAKNHGVYPTVRLHSLRSTSVTYKLAVSKGDIKSVQGDTGHATAKMVTDTYAKIQDKSRKKMAEALEQSFYKDSKAPEAPTTPREDAATRMQAAQEKLSPTVDQAFNDQILLDKIKEKVKENPEMLDILLSALKIP